MRGIRVFEVYESGRCPIFVSLRYIVDKIDATTVLKVLVEKLYANSALSDDDLEALLGEDFQIKSWTRLDFCKERPEESGIFSDDGKIT